MTDRRRENLALLVVVVGVLMTAIDATIVFLALPEIDRSLHIGLAGEVWTVNGYLLVITVASTQMGRLGDMFGRARMYETGFVIFVAGSFACALAWAPAALVAFRVLQGVGGAIITANSGAVIADTFDVSTRGRAYGINSVGWGTGAVLGVVLGGIIVTYISWRWIFWISVPIGIAAAILARRVLVDRPGSQHRMDWWGIVTLALGLFGLLWAMIGLGTEPASVTQLLSALGGVASLLVFWRVEGRVAEPMLDRNLFRIPTMTASLLAALLQSLANFAVLYLLLMYLQGLRHLSPINASLILVPGYIVGAVTGPFAGRVADRFGAVIPATTGLAIQVVALLIYAQLGPATPLLVVALIYMLGAFGGGWFFPSNSSAVMKRAADNALGTTAGLLRTFSNVGMVFSFSVAVLVCSVAISRPKAFEIFAGVGVLSGPQSVTFLHAMRAAFYASTSLMILAAVLSASRARRPGSPGDRDPDPAEVSAAGVRRSPRSAPRRGAREPGEPA
jgi:EmrB/QacA subfamily drug resistance transporter